MKKIGFIAMAFWVILAVVSELVALIPFVGIIIGPAFNSLFAFYIWKMGYGFINPRRLAVMAIGTIVEMIPVIQELPIELIITTVIVLIMLRIEAKTGISVTSMANPGKALNKGGVRMPSASRPPLNNQGVRMPPNDTLAA